MLSSLEGSAVTSVKIQGVDHEFTSMKGVMEDATDLVLNIKGLVVRLQGDEPKTMKVAANKVGVVTALDIVADPAIEVINPDTMITMPIRPSSALVAHRSHGASCPPSWA